MITVFVLKTIRIYQGFVSPLIGNHCRFYPTCSEYFIQTIQKNGLIKGTFKGIKRILKCHSFNKGGVDLPY